MAAIVLAALAAAHAVVVDVRAAGSAVVGGKNENGVFSKPFLFEERAHGADVVVDVGDHAEKVGHVDALFGVGLGGFLRRMHRAVRGVGAEINEERLVAVLHLGDEALSIIKKHIGAKTLDRHGFAVVKIGAIKVGVVPKIGRLPHAATTVAQHFLKAAILRAVRIVVAQVPFAKHAGVVTAIAENPADGHLVMAQHRPAHDRVPHTGAIGPASSDQRRPRRRTRRRHVVIR